MNNIGCKCSLMEREREKKTQMVVWAELVTLELKQCDVSNVVTVIKLFTS